MRVRPSTLAAFAALAAGVLLTAGCSSSTPSGGGPAEANPSTGNPNADVGPALYKPGAMPELKFVAAKGGDPLVISNCTVQYEERQQVAAEVEGKIDLLATRDDGLADNDPNLVYHPRDLALKAANPAHVMVKYRRLTEGDVVKAGQVICLLDDQLVTAKIEAATKSKAAAEEIEKAATEGVNLTKKQLALLEEGVRKGVVSQTDLIQSQTTLTRFIENLAQAKQTIVKAESDLKEATVILGRHQIKSNVTGIIRSIAKRQGEFVKGGDKILEVQSTEKVRLEGNLPVEYAAVAVARRGKMVDVEPALPSAPAKSHGAHRSEVTGLAVTAHPGRPMVVSASADGTVRVWDLTRDTPTHNLPHPVAVRSVAASPAAAKAILVVTGSDDGKVRVWDVGNPDKLPTTPRELAEGHASAVGCVAFSPDGKFFATAAGREVFVWEADSGKKLYALPAEHRDVVTCVHFTPQATLVTASRDRTIKVWKLGGDRGAAASTIEHRAGAVDFLGVTKDGGRVVFDQDKNRLDLVSLADKQTVGQVQNTGVTAAFSTLAVFNSDDSLLVTAGGEGELKGGLQVWTVPAAGGRGSEIGRLITPGRATVTCAAFSPTREQPFLVVGTTSGTVHMWVPPAEAGRKGHQGKVVNVDPTDPRYVTVRVEMDNRQLNLPDRSAATIIINPGQ